MSNRTDEKRVSVYIVPIFTLIDVITGVALTHFSTAYLARQQRRSELQQESYATILALRPHGAQRLHSLPLPS